MVWFTVSGPNNSILFLTIMSCIYIFKVTTTLEDILPFDYIIMPMKVRNTRFIIQNVSRILHHLLATAQLMRRKSRQELQRYTEMFWKSILMSHDSDCCH